MYGYLDIDELINELLELQYKEPNTEADISEERILYLLEEAEWAFSHEHAFVEVETPITICGSLFPISVIPRRHSWSVLRFAKTLLDKWISSAKISLLRVASGIPFHT